MKVHLNDGSPLPADANYFIVAGNGTFVRKRMGWVEATVPVASIDGLQPQTTEAKLLLPRITSTVFAKAVLFFRAVYEQKDTEAAVLLHYGDKRGWSITVPEQEATGSHVSYKTSERLPGYQCVGTIHSHCAMNAFHSGTDVGDEASHDGVHITIGLLNRFPKFGMDAEFVVNGTRFPLSHEHIVRVRMDEEVPAQAVSPQMFCAITKRQTLYSMPFGIVHDWTVPQEWVERVKKKTWTFTDIFNPLGGYAEPFPRHRPQRSVATDFKEEGTI